MTVAESTAHDIDGSEPLWLDPSAPFPICIAAQIVPRPCLSRREDLPPNDVKLMIMHGIVHFS